MLLEPQRAVGGRLAAGDKVGVVVSLKLEDGTAEVSRDGEVPVLTREGSRPHRIRATAYDDELGRGRELLGRMGVLVD